MSGDVWESLVETYLTRSGGIFVNPSFVVGKAGVWEACVDFLALDFRTSEAWVVEVTAGSGFDKIARKAAEFDREYVPRIRGQLNETGFRMADLMGWSIGLWAFVRRSQQENCHRVLSGVVARSRVSALEDVAFPWEYWDQSEWQGALDHQRPTAFTASSNGSSAV